MSRDFPPIFLVSIKPDQNELLFPATFLIEQNGAIAVSDAAVLFVHFSISDTFISLDDMFIPKTNPSCHNPIETQHSDRGTILRTKQTKGNEK